MNTGTLQQRYHNLEERDRQALHWLTLFLGLIILIYGIFLPSYRYYDTAKSSFFEQGDLLTWVQNNATAVKAAQNNIEPDRPQQPLMQAVTNSVSKFGIEANRIQPEGGKLRTWLNKVPFDKSIKWLTDLTRENSIMIEQISVEKTAKPGIVNIQCLLAPL